MIRSRRRKVGVEERNRIRKSVRVGEDRVAAA